MKISIGNLVDALSICNIRIWFAENTKRDSKDDSEIAKACKITNKANSLRNKLIEEIDLTINEMIENGEVQELFGQGSTKLYGKDKK